MINKVYLVVEDWSADFENGVDINVFKDLEKAQEYIKQRIEEEKSHIPTKPIAKVKVLVPYGNGFDGKDVAKYLI